MKADIAGDEPLYVRASKLGAPISSITTPGEDGMPWKVGEIPWGEKPNGATVLSITPYMMNGQMAEVRWFLVEYSDGRCIEVNGSMVETVVHEAEEATDE